MNLSRLLHRARCPLCSGPLFVAAAPPLDVRMPSIGEAAASSRPRASVTTAPARYGRGEWADEARGSAAADILALAAVITLALLLGRELVRP